MSTSTKSIPTASELRGSIRRVWAITRAEMALLVRNKTAMFTALVLPFFLVVGFVSFSEIAELGVYIATSIVGFVLVLVVYANLVATYVARREELVLKRLRVSTATDGEILAAAAVPALVVALVQILVGLVAAIAVLDVALPANPVLLLVGIAGGAAVFVLLAAASTAFTKTVEMAQVTTLPVFLVSLVFSGLMFPLDVMPDLAANAARLVPLTPVVELTQLGLQGSVGNAAPMDFAGTFGAALVPALVLALWTFLGVWSVRRWFRWEPRA